MCDVQLQRHGRGFLFAKNSDREASEPQLVRRFRAVHGDRTSTLQTTYIVVDQVPDRLAVVLSQPGWIWGAEMGANERGVVIGNTAVFSRLATAEKGLIGMDLVRLALERAARAEDAMHVITSLLERHGQGGPCGFRNKGFLYDNAFLIADAHDAWQLETAGRHWVARRVQDHAAISNCMSIGSEFDMSSAGVEDFARQRGYSKKGDTFDFARAFETHLMPVASGARLRRRLSLQCLGADRASASLATMMMHLRQHNATTGSFRHNHDVCMHAADLLTRPSQATAAMVADTATDGLQMLFTGTSATCRSIFRPVRLDAQDWSVLSENLWLDHESVQRRMALGLLPEEDFGLERDQLERQLIQSMSGSEVELQRLDAAIVQWHRRWVERARAIAWRYSPVRSSHWFWRQMNRRDAVV